MSFSKIALVLVVLVLLLLARKSKPASDAEGAGFFGNQINANPLVLTVATYNIQTGKNHRGKRNIDASANVLKNADIVGVQEVYAPSLANLIGIGKPQTDAVANDNFAYLFAPTRRRWLRDHRGNAVLSKLPIKKWRTTMLPDKSGKSFRNFTVTHTRWGDAEFAFINTHLHTGKGRDEQLKIVLAEFVKYERAILVGDFNTAKANSIIKSFMEVENAIDAIGKLELDPNEDQRIDWILVRGFDVIDGYFEPIGVSDHPYYQVSLRLD